VRPRCGPSRRTCSPLFFQPLVSEARSGGMSKTTANIIKKHAMLAGHRMGSDPVFLHRRWLQRLSIKV
jgi:hypothetical protein